MEEIKKTSLQKCNTQSLSKTPPSTSPERQKQHFSQENPPLQQRQRNTLEIKQSFGEAEVTKNGGLSKV